MTGSPTKQLPGFLKLVLLFLLLDGIGNALPSSFAMALPRDYNNESGIFYFGRFFQNLGFGTIMYIIRVFWVYPVLALVFLAVALPLKRISLYYIGAGMGVALIFDLYYAYNWSADPFMSYFYYRILWFGCLGGLFGWIYYRKGWRIKF
jgi:small-conductance mechanosensitive channel